MQQITHDAHLPHATCNRCAVRLLRHYLLQPIDARLEAIVEKMFDRCFADQECVVDIATHQLLRGLRVRGAKWERGLAGEA